jgi:hypothetical protein
MLPQVGFAYNATRALVIEHTPCEANFGFSLEEQLDLSFCIRPPIPVSQDATWRAAKVLTRSTCSCTLGFIGT